MGKHVKRKQLTPEQFKMANKTMSIILAICYVLYITVESSKVAEHPHGYFRIAIYVAVIIGNGIITKLKSTKKAPMLFMAVTFLISYLLLVMNNGAICMILAFPTLIGFMLYLNSLLNIVSRKIR